MTIDTSRREDKDVAKTNKAKLHWMHNPIDPNQTYLRQIAGAAQATADAQAQQMAGDAAMREWTIAAVTSLQGQVDTLRAEVETLRAELACLGE